MSDWMVGLLAFVFIQNALMFFMLGYLWRASKEGGHHESERHPNGTIEQLEDAMAGNANGLLAIDRTLAVVKGTLAYVEAELSSMQGHLGVTRQELGSIRGRPFDARDRDKEQG